MARKYSNSSDRMLMTVMVIIVIAVLALGIFAVSGKVSKNVKSNRVNSADRRVGDMADQSGMELNDYLEEYGLTADSGITAKSTPQEMAEKLNLENYSQFYYGIELTDDEFASFKKDQEVADDVQKDTEDADVKAKYDTYAIAKLQAEQASEAAAEQAAAESEEPAAEPTAEEVPAATADAAE